MNIVYRWLPFLTFIFIAIFLMLLNPDSFSSSQTSQNTLPNSNQEKKGDVIDQVMKNVHLMETAGDEKEWELWADSAISFKGHDSWSVKKVKVIFFRDDGIEMTVVGDRGTIRVETKDMLIEKNVITTTTDNYRFLTESLVYNSKNRELKTAHPVKIESPLDSKGHRIILNGVGLLADMKKSRLFLHRDVHGIKRMSGEKSLKIRSNEASMSSFSNKATFIGQVVMNLETLTVTGPKAVFTSSKDKVNASTITIDGGARVSDVDKWATADNLRIFLDQKKYIFRGNPRVVQNNDEIRGKEIVFLNGGDQIQVKSGKATLSEEN